ncbi:hypothetical protein [Pseudomonas entomophila]|uniref:hypothetical protein n=1 Tax=Pseudomonas entomophila TaxID=312306 RepID=UPI003EB9FAF0
MTFDPTMTLDPLKIILRSSGSCPSCDRSIYTGALASGLVLAQRFGASVDQGTNTCARIQFELVKDLMGVESPSARLIRHLDQRLLRIAEKLGAVERLAPRVMRQYLQ